MSGPVAATPLDRKLTLATRTHARSHVRLAGPRGAVPPSPGPRCPSSAQRVAPALPPAAAAPGGGLEN